MCDMTSDPIEVTAGVPKDVEALRKGLIQILQQGMKQGATQYTGPIAPQTNPLLLSSANMLMGLMGQGAYKQPGYYSMAGSPAGSGGATYPWSSQGVSGAANVGKIPAGTDPWVDPTTGGMGTGYKLPPGWAKSRTGWKVGGPTQGDTVKGKKKKTESAK